jgi:hypothetical protein
MAGSCFCLAKRRCRGYLRAAMTRSSIELVIKIFLVALIVVFCLTVVGVLRMIS